MNKPAAPYVLSGMKKPFLLALMLAALSFLGSFSRVQAQEENISFQVFYDALSPYGDWINVDGYGYCWRPSVDEDWTPYTDGNWAYTDAGWTWCGNEAWSWAPYHYGRWTQLQGWGWVWVPGYEWAPAWVSWRTGDDYVGWAPLPPTAVWIANTGFNSTVEVEYGIAPSFYSFCPVQYFGAHQLRPYLRPYWTNGEIIGRTRNVTRMNRNGNSLFIYNGGPNFAEVNQRVQQPFQQVRLEPQRNVDPQRLIAGQGRNRLQNNVLQVVAPTVVDATAQPASIAAQVPRPQVIRPTERVPNGRRQENQAANAAPVQNIAPPAASYPPPGVASQPDNQDGAENPGRHDHSDRLGRPGQPQGSGAIAAPAPVNPSVRYRSNVPPNDQQPISASGTAGHYLQPYQRPQAQPQNSGQATGGQPQNPHVVPTEEQLRRAHLAKLAAQQQAAQQQAAQQQAAQQQAAPQRMQQQQVQPQPQPMAPGGSGPGGYNPGVGRHKGQPSAGGG